MQPLVPTNLLLILVRRRLCRFVWSLLCCHAAAVCAEETLIERGVPNWRYLDSPSAQTEAWESGAGRLPISMIPRGPKDRLYWGTVIPTFAPRFPSAIILNAKSRRRCSAVDSAWFVAVLFACCEGGSAVMTVLLCLSMVVKSSGATCRLAV